MKAEIGFNEARELVSTGIKELPGISMSLEKAGGMHCSADIHARVSCPSIDASLKDGYAVVSSDLTNARADNPVELKVIGNCDAGTLKGNMPRLVSGTALRVTSGTAMPEGAGSVLAEEFTRLEGDRLTCLNTAEEGRNILTKGTDAAEGELIAPRGRLLTPPLLGLLAAAGHGSVPVSPLPTVAVIATGDEIIAPGLSLPEGKLYASNLTELCAWLAVKNLASRFTIAGDSREEIRDAILEHIDHADAFVTSGGAWKSERDLIVDVFHELGWEGIFHRVKMGPGKAIAFGHLKGKPVFCLPGGPPSNEMAFLQLALPGLMRMGGSSGPLFSTLKAELTKTVKGQGDWTQFIGVKLHHDGDRVLVTPVKEASRLRSMASRDGLIVIPEGEEIFRAGSVVEVQVSG